jgi:hypothetical protein
LSASRIGDQQDGPVLCHLTDDAEQLGGRRPAPATHTGADRNPPGWPGHTHWITVQIREPGRGR